MSNSKSSQEHLLPASSSQRNSWEHGHSTKRTAVVTIAAITTTILFSICGVLLWYAHPPHDKLQQPCGNTSAEAYGLGCSFDQLMWAWFPPYCPHYANEDYLSVMPWSWYTDAHLKTRIQPAQWSQVLDNNITVYGEEQEHNTHCLHMLFRAVPKHTDMEHLEHCVHALEAVILRDDMRFKITTKAGRVSFDQDC
jgi:hypothetical protein